MNLCYLFHRIQHQIHLINNKIFAINLEAQSFLGHHLVFHILYAAFLRSHTFLQLGCFGLDTSYYMINEDLSLCIYLFELENIFKD